jgi:hypothetical protein
MRSERQANEALARAAGAVVPTWQRPSPLQRRATVTEAGHLWLPYCAALCLLALAFV